MDCGQKIMVGAGEGFVCSECSGSFGPADGCRYVAVDGKVRCPTCVDAIHRARDAEQQ